MSREVCGICWCPYDEETGACGCEPASKEHGMTTLRTAAQQALEALQNCANGEDDVLLTRDALAALRAALAEPVQEPVGYWGGEFSHDGGAVLYEVPQQSAFGFKYRNEPLYAAPFQRKPPTNQCGETCERAKLCAVCARGLATGDNLSPTKPVQEPQLKRIHPLDMPLEVFVEDLSTRPRNIINAEMGYFTHLGDKYIKPPLTVRHLLMFSRKELRKWPNLGKRSLNEIEEMLRNRGLQLWDEHDERSLRLLREHPTYFRAALAEPVQEPVCDKDPRGCYSVRCQLGRMCKHATPPQRKPPATIDEMFDRMDKAPKGVFFGHDPMTIWMEAWRAAERAHGITP